MCVICHALKKKHINRAEVETAMDNNCHGFFMAALHPDGTRTTVRTPDKKEALAFFDTKVSEDDAFVMHARIKSRGAVCLDNIHGWEEDGVMFTHNMTLSDLDKVMEAEKWAGTDSEFFFRKVFMKFYRGLGESAYKDGAFSPVLDDFVRRYCGYSNKFLFIMPDNRIIRYGNWVEESDRREDGKVAFYASNGSYRVSAFKSERKTFGNGGVASNAGFCRNSAAYCDDDYDDYYGFFRDPAKPAASSGSSVGSGVASKGRAAESAAVFAAAGKTGKSGKAGGYGASGRDDSAFTGEALLGALGVGGVLRLAVQGIVLRNVVSLVNSEIHDYGKEDHSLISSVIESSLPKCFSFTNIFTLDKLIGELFHTSGAEPGLGETCNVYELYAKDELEDLAAVAAAIFEADVVHEEYSYAMYPSSANIAAGIKKVNARIELMCRLLNVSIDFSETNPLLAAVAFFMEDMGKTGAGMNEFDAVDILYVGSLTVEEASSLFESILFYLNDPSVLDESAEDAGSEGSVQSEQTAASGDAVPVEPEESAPSPQTAKKHDKKKKPPKKKKGGKK